MHCIFLVLVPWTTIITMNVCIIYHLSKSRRKVSRMDTSKDSLSSRMRQDRQMSIVLLTITFSFLIFLAWMCVSQCFYMLDHGKSSNNHHVWHLVSASFAFGSLGAVFNSSMNFFLYCLSGSRFRRELLRLFGRKRDLLIVGSSSSDRSTSPTSPTSPKRKFQSDGAVASQVFTLW